MTKKRLAVFCSATISHLGMRRIIHELCMDLAKDYDLIWGYGRAGLMGVVADGFEKGGAEVFGYGVAEFNEKEANDISFADPFRTIMYSEDYTSPYHVNGGLADRTYDMIKDCDAILVLPCGMGGLLELSMAYVLKQSKLMEQKPIVIVDIYGYFKHLRQFMYECYVDYKSMSAPHKYMTWIDADSRNRKSLYLEVKEAVKC